MLTLIFMSISYIGLCQVNKIDTGRQLSVYLLRINISLHKLISQSYDGAATMVDLRYGVPKQI